MFLGIIYAFMTYRDPNMEWELIPGLILLGLDIIILVLINKSGD